MKSFFKKKVNNFQDASDYREKLILTLEGYLHQLYIINSRQEAKIKCTIILEYINFQFPIHCVSEMNRKTVNKISNMFAKQFQKLNWYNITESEQRKIVTDYFKYIVETYAPESQNEIK